MTRVFLDAEFTQFRDGQLLSLGVVALNGQECYVEIADPARHSTASDFCQRTVLTQFGCIADAGVLDDAAAGARVADWFESMPGPVEVSYDYKLDWRFLESALRAAGRWEALSRRLLADNVAGVAAPGTPGEAAQDAVFEEGSVPGRHHALVDARALRAAWLAQSR